MASIVGDLHQGSGQRALHDLHPGALIAAEAGLEAIEAGGELHQGAAAASDDPLFHCGPGGIEGIFNAQFAVAQFCFGGGPHLDHSHAAGQFGDALVQFFAVVVGVGGLQFPLDRGHSLDHGLLVVAAGHQGGAVLGDRDPADPAQVVEGHLVEGHGPVFADQGGAREDGDVLEGGLTALAEGGGPHGRHLEHTAVLVDHQGGQGFAIDFLGQDQQGRAAAGHGLKHGHQVGDGADLAVGDQQEGVVVFADLPFGVGDEIGGAVAPIEGHPFGDFQLGGQGAGFLHRDHAIHTHGVHGLGDHGAHFLVAAGTDGGHLADRLAGHGLGPLSNRLHQLGHGLVHPAAQAHRIGAGRDVAQAFAGHGLGEHRGSGGAITGLVLGFGRHLQEQLGADVFEGIFEFNLAGNCDPVVDHIGGAEFLFQHHIAALGAEGDLDRIGEGINPPLKGGTGCVGEANQLGHRGLGQQSNDLRLP